MDYCVAYYLEAGHCILIKPNYSIQYCVFKN
jgi:hypothetical protein